MIYGLLLATESQVEARVKTNSEKLLTWFRSGYLVLQTGLIIGILIIPPLNDFGAMLFIPISLQAVLFFQRRTGFLWISIFTLVMTVILPRGGENFPGGLAMALLFGGICFFAGSYAHLILAENMAEQENQRMLGELQSAYRQLKNYASELEELAAEHERIRLARDMHDSVTQTVFSMNLTIQSARLLLNKDRLLVNEQLDRLLELAGKAMSEIQALITHLRPAPILGEDIVQVVQRLIAEKRRFDNLEVSLDYSRAVNLHSLETDCLSKIVQEALTNIVKHAETQEANIRINLTTPPHYLEIEDRGIGFTAGSEPDSSGHHGLRGMSERAKEIGWSFSIESQPGHGTLIRVEAGSAEK